MLVADHVNVDVHVHVHVHVDVDVHVHVHVNVDDDFRRSGAVAHSNKVSCRFGRS